MEDPAAANHNLEALTRLAVEQERRDLERQELEAPLGCPPHHVYANLMLVYLIENDLCQAKFLWKRIPDEVKAASAELGRIWEVGKAMFRKDPPGVHTALRGEWSSHTQKYIDRLRGIVVNRYLEAIGSAYTSISLGDFCQFLGLPEGEAVALARQQAGWTVDGGMILPQRKKAPVAKAAPSEERLSQLTDYIAFLEK